MKTFSILILIYEHKVLLIINECLSTEIFDVSFTNYRQTAINLSERILYCFFYLLHNITTNFTYSTSKVLIKSFASPTYSVSKLKFCFQVFYRNVI